MGCGCNGSTYTPPTPEEIAAHQAAGTEPPAPPMLTGPDAPGYFHNGAASIPEPPVFDAAGHNAAVTA